MPYFIFAVKPFGQLELLDQRVAYAEAAREARALRAAQAQSAQRRIRIVFADNALAAEDLLLQPREALPDGDD